MRAILAVGWRVRYDRGREGSSMRRVVWRAVSVWGAAFTLSMGAVGIALGDPVDGLTVRGRGYPSRDANLDALAGFQQPPSGYGEVPFWWWTGDPLDADRLIWQLDQLHQKGIAGVQINYAHEDSPGWPTYAAQPPIFSDPWWQIWGRIADECRQRGMGIGLSTYTLDWPNGDNLFRRLFYAKPELNALRLEPPVRQRVRGGQAVVIPLPDQLVTVRVPPRRRSIAARRHRFDADGASRQHRVDRS